MGPEDPSTWPGCGGIWNIASRPLTERGNAAYSTPGAGKSASTSHLTDLPNKQGWFLTSVSRAVKWYLKLLVLTLVSVQELSWQFKSHFQAAPVWFTAYFPSGRCGGSRNRKRGIGEMTSNAERRQGSQQWLCAQKQKHLPSSVLAPFPHGRLSKPSSKGVCPQVTTNSKILIF